MSSRHSGNSYIYMTGLTVIAALSGILMGLDIGIIGGSGPFIFETFSIGNAEVFLKGATVAAVPFGALLGAVVSAFLSFRIGRKYSLLLTGFVYSLGVIAISTAPSIDLVISGRVLMGFAVGLSAMVAPMYLAEVSAPQMRGAMVFLFQLAVTIGILLAYAINYAFSSQGDWRSMFLSCLVPAVIFTIGVFFLPKSPRWLIQRGRELEAIGVLKRIRDELNVDAEVNEIKEATAHRRIRFRQIFSKRFLPLVILAFGLFVFQQLSGINTIFYYVEVVFHNAGFNVQNAILAGIPAATVNVLATIIAIWVIDRLGRRKVLLVGMAVVAVCLFILVLAYHHVFPVADTGLIVLVTVLVFIAFYAVSLGGIPYVVMSEIFPINGRHWGMSIASFANWGFNTFVGFTYVWFLSLMGSSNTYLMYGVITAIGFILMFYFLPETKGCSLEKIERHLDQGLPLRTFGRGVPAA